METESISFGILDYILFSGMLLISAAVGVYFQFTGGKQRTTEEINLGDRKMSIYPVAFSLMASFSSAIGMLGFASENYLHGFQLSIYAIAPILGMTIVIYVYHPVFYKMQFVTVYEYLDRRFGKATRILGSLTFMTRMIAFMAVVLYAPALAMNTVMGISLRASILIVGLVCTFYCTIGGIKAVLWTDLIQGIIMYASLIVVIGKGCIDAGGITNVWKLASEGGRTKFPSFNPNPTVRYTFWSLIIGGTFIQVATNAGTQTQVQRMLTTKSIEKSRQAIWVSLPLKVIFTLGICFSGIMMYAIFGSCDPFLRKEQTGLTAYDQLLPYFIMKSLGHLPGLPGLCIAGLFSASLSSLSSVINSLAAVVMEDFIRPHCCVQRMTESRAAFITRGLALMFGLLSLLLSYLVEKLGGLVQALFTISGVFGGPLLGLFSLGMLFKKPNQTGAITGLIVSVVFGLWISSGARMSNVKHAMLPFSIAGCPNFTSLMSNGTDSHPYSNISQIYNTSSVSQLSTIVSPPDDRYVFPLYRVSHMWYSPICCLTTVIVGYLVSLMTGPNVDVDPQLLSPAVKWSFKKMVKRKKDIPRYPEESFLMNSTKAFDAKEEQL